LLGAARVECQVLLNCTVANFAVCTLFGLGAVTCYCSDATCSAGANGPCASQFETVAGTHDPAEIVRQINDPTTTVGGVSAEAIKFSASSCGFPCTGR
jgi:hypothetical protein